MTDHDPTCNKVQEGGNSYAFECDCGVDEDFTDVNILAAVSEVIATGHVVLSEAGLSVEFTPTLRHDHDEMHRHLIDEWGCLGVVMATLRTLTDDQARQLLEAALRRVDQTSEDQTPMDIPSARWEWYPRTEGHAGALLRDGVAIAIVHAPGDPKAMCDALNGVVTLPDAERVKTHLREQLGAEHLVPSYDAIRDVLAAVADLLVDGGGDG